MIAVPSSSSVRSKQLRIGTWYDGQQHIGAQPRIHRGHLQTSYGLTPETYRARWGLPSNYPMVAPSYAERRSALAKSIGLGRKPAGTEAAVAPSEQHVTPVPKTRGRRQAKVA